MPAQHNNQTNNALSDNSFNISSGVSIQGYTSPYAGTPIMTQQTPQPGQQIVSQNPDTSSQTNNQNPPSLEEFLAQSQASTTNGNSDNLLDNNEHVDRILQEGAIPINPTPPTQPGAPANNPEPTPTVTPAPQTQTIPTNTVQPSIPTVTSVIQTPQSIPQPTESNPQINPNVDLQKRQSEKTYTKISELFELVIERNASDLHLSVGYPAYIRIDDKLVPVGSVLNKEDVKNLIMQSLTQNHKELLEVNREVDLSYQYEDKVRFRVNAYFEKGNLAAAYRLIPNQIRSITDLGLPGILLDIARLSQGLFLVTGPTGSGKSTTLAAMIQHINETSPKHIITIEDPIEYVYPKATALIDQRELGSDTHDWGIAMKSALRQDPDVILIGELRDFETIQSAITLAETGHLVFATLHTNSAAQSIDRIIDVFPPHQQQQIKTQLAGTLKGILSQRLVPLIGGGRVAVVELLIVTPAVQNLIREGKTYQIDNVIATSADAGMISLEKSLVKLVRQGKISTVTAQDYAIRPEEILKLLKSQG